MIGIGVVVSIFIFGNFLKHQSANLLEDVTVDKDDKSLVGFKRDMKEIRSVAPGAYFYSLEK